MVYLSFVELNNTKIQLKFLCAEDDAHLAFVRKRLYFLEDEINRQRQETKRAYSDGHRCLAVYEFCANEIPSRHSAIL